MLLTAFSGSVLVQFCYSNFFFQSPPFLLLLLLFSFLPVLSVSAHRGKISFETKTIKINYVEIELLNLIQLQLKMMTLAFIE